MREQMDTASVTESSEQLAALAAERDLLAQEKEHLLREKEQLAQEKSEIQDSFLRRQAEFDNARKRAERERMEFAQMAGMDVVNSILPTLDDLDRALKAASAAADGTNAEFIKGVEMIYQRLTDSLKKIGLESVPTAGQKFDPHVHHAVEMVQDEELEDHTILDEYQAGYNFKGRLLRPAMVKVAVRP